MNSRVLYKIEFKLFMPSLEREREREACRRRRSSAWGDVEEVEAWCAMAPMAARNSESASSGSGGGDGRRANRWSSGRRREWRRRATWWRWRSFLSASRYPKSVELWRRPTSDTVPRPPHFLFIALATGPTSHNGLGAPNQGASRSQPNFWIGVGDQLQQND